MKVRKFVDKNYMAIFDRDSHQTLRLALDAQKPILGLDFPELLDISLGTKCLAYCPYCYVCASADGVLYQNVVEKVSRWFGKMKPEERPFQVAIGGGGEPTLHPDFVRVLETFAAYDILPNYTTNAMHLSEKILTATKKYCGGVAVSCHPYLNLTWQRGVSLLKKYDIKTNLHIVVGEKGSTERFAKIYDRYQDKINTFVLLPYQYMGRAANINTVGEWEKLFDLVLDKKYSKIAFGALFYEFISKNKDKYSTLEISMYEPEIFSGYVMMDSDELIIRKSSFNPT